MGRGKSQVEAISRIQRNHPFLVQAKPEIAEQWIRTVNSKGEGKTPENTRAMSGVRVLWQCPNHPEHQWEARVSGRMMGDGCPKCIYSERESFAVVHPDLAKQWIRVIEPRYKDRRPDNTTAMSAIRVLWQCPKDPSHQWEARVDGRSAGGVVLNVITVM